MRLEKRTSSSRAALLLAPAGALGFTLLVSALLVLWAGAPVGKTYAALFKGGFGSLFAWSETLTRAVPLMLTGLSAAVAFRARLCNIGAEGQLYAGALAAVAVGGLHGGTGFELSPWLLMPLMMLFIFYHMPSALVLYWTANQVLMIVQLLWQKRVTSKTA